MALVVAIAVGVAVKVRWWSTDMRCTRAGSVIVARFQSVVKAKASISFLNSFPKFNVTQGIPVFRFPHWEFIGILR